jgi:D-alanyl-D-alanine endopeptidase (penicillin-binding protein 7)
MKKLLLAILIVFTLPAYSKSITATSWLVADGFSNIIQSENVDEVRPIASISKLMAVMVVLDADQNPTTVIAGFTREQRITMALVKSDNNSAKLLCDYYPGGKLACITAMNNKAQELGMTHTHFIEPTGLSVFNVSTARELIKLVDAASTYPSILTASASPSVKIHMKKRWLIVYNTNPIIGKRHKFLVSKTGYIHASGGCIVMMLDTDIGRRIVIVLGSKNTRTRIPEAEFIAESY